LPSKKNICIYKSRALIKNKKEKRKEKKEKKNKKIKEKV